MVLPAVAAAERLAKEGIRASVFDARFVQPLDGDAIAELATRCGRIVTVEEAVLAGGFGSAVLEMLAARNLPTPALRLGIPDILVPHGTRAQQLAGLGLTPDGLAKSVGAWVATTQPVLP